MHCDAARLLAAPCYAARKMITVLSGIFWPLREHADVSSCLKDSGATHMHLARKLHDQLYVL